MLLLKTDPSHLSEAGRLSWRPPGIEGNGRSRLCKRLAPCSSSACTISFLTPGAALLAMTNNAAPGVKKEIVQALEEHGARRLHKRLLPLPSIPGGRHDKRPASERWEGSVFNRSI